MNEDLAEVLETLRVKHAATLDINERIALRFAARVLRGLSEVEPEADADGWIKWDGNKLGPFLPVRTEVLVQMDNGYEGKGTVGYYLGGPGSGKDWNNWDSEDKQASPIIRYRITGAANPPPCDGSATNRP